MDVTIHRGTREIGGSCVEVSAGDTRIILDVGLPLVNPDREPFDSSSMRGKSTEQLIEEGVIPRVPGLFTEGDPPAAILLSHSHLDHVGLLEFTRSEIPVYTTTGTSKMMLAGSQFGRGKRLDSTRHVPVTSQRSFEIGCLKVTPYAVDHSCFGSVAFLIEGDGKAILYSGDLRRHGRKPGMLKTLIAEVGCRTVDAIVMEGTHVGFDRGKDKKSEEQLEDEIHGHITASKNLILASFSPIDVDRIVTYYKASTRADRIFVADVYTAYVMRLVASEVKLPDPCSSRTNIRVYYNKAFMNRSEARRKKPEELFAKKQIMLDEIQSNPSRYVMMFRPTMATMDFGGNLPPGARCVYSYWKGYLDKVDWVVCQEQLRAAGGDLVPAHASGHIYQDDLVEVVKAIGAKTVIPIHTFEPAGFEKLFDNVTRLADGERYRVE
jgi:ribonuclease J